MFFYCKCCIISPNVRLVKTCDYDCIYLYTLSYPINFLFNFLLHNNINNFIGRELIIAEMWYGDNLLFETDRL